MTASPIGRPGRLHGEAVFSSARSWFCCISLRPAAAGNRSFPSLTGQPVILCAGDSITAASYPEHLKKLLLDDGLSVQVINAGAKGDSTAEYIRFLDRSQIVERTDPGWVLLQLGTNDLRIDSHATTTEQFRKNLEAILDRFGRHRGQDGSSPRVILATIPPIPVEVRWHFNAGSRARVETEINPVIRDIARRRGLVLADHSCPLRQPARPASGHSPQRGRLPRACRGLAPHPCAAPLALTPSPRKEKP